MASVGAYNVGERKLSKLCATTLKTNPEGMFVTKYDFRVSDEQFLTSRLFSDGFGVWIYGRQSSLAELARLELRYMMRWSCVFCRM